MIFSLNKTKNNRKFLVGNETQIIEPAYIDANCKIGSYTYIGSYSNITKAEIGNYCSIGNNVVIGAGEHDINAISTSAFIYDGIDWYEELTQKDCIIKNDVWIGTQSIIRRGVSVGNGAVIGANSFVNKDVPDFAVVAGSPAKIIKYRFSDEVRTKILNSNWWNYNPENAKNIIANLNIENV